MPSNQVTDGNFEVVFVCTGNRARSPLAEALFRRYSAGLEVLATSYGIQDVGPIPALAHAIEAGARLGVDLTSHRARALMTANLASSDLVVGFEPIHVSAAVIDGGADAGRAFLLGEIVMLLDDPIDVVELGARARNAVAVADSRRVRTRPNPAARVVGDPIGKGPDVMSRRANEIDELIRQLVVGLFGDDADGGRPQVDARFT